MTGQGGSAVMRGSARCARCLDSHNGWVDEVHMTLQALGERVGERADESRVSRVLVRKTGEIRVEQAVRLADRDVDDDPVTSRGNRRRVQAVLLQPRADHVFCVLTGRDKRLNL